MTTAAITPAAITAVMGGFPGFPAAEKEVNGGVIAGGFDISADEEAAAAALQALPSSASEGEESDTVSSDATQGSAQDILALASGDPPAEVAVTCKDEAAVYVVASGMVRLGSGELVKPGVFEKAAGCSGKKWRQNLKVFVPEVRRKVPLGEWLRTSGTPALSNRERNALAAADAAQPPARKKKKKKPQPPPPQPPHSRDPRECLPREPEVSPISSAPAREASAGSGPKVKSSDYRPVHPLAQRLPREPEVSPIPAAPAREASAAGGPKVKSSDYRGVSRVSRVSAQRPWEARHHALGQNQFLGAFVTEEEAARAVDRFAISFWGHERAQTNYDVEEYRAEWAALEALDVEGAIALIKPAKLLPRQRAPAAPLGGRAPCPVPAAGPSAAGEADGAGRPDEAAAAPYRHVARIRDAAGGDSEAPWRAEVHLASSVQEDLRVHVGDFRTAEEAARAADRYLVGRLGEEGAAGLTNFAVEAYRAEALALRALDLVGLVDHIRTVALRERRSAEAEALLAGLPAVPSGPPPSGSKRRVAPAGFLLPKKKPKREAGPSETAAAAAAEGEGLQGLQELWRAAAAAEAEKQQLLGLNEQLLEEHAKAVGSLLEARQENHQLLLQLRQQAEQNAAILAALSQMGVVLP